MGNIGEMGKINFVTIKLKQKLKRKWSKLAKMALMRIRIDKELIKFQRQQNQLKN